MTTAKAGKGLSRLAAGSVQGESCWGDLIKWIDGGRKPVEGLGFRV